MGEKGAEEYKELQTSNARGCVEFFLLNSREKLPPLKSLGDYDKYPQIDFNKCYDIITHEKQYFNGCNLRYDLCHVSMGVMGSVTSINGFFQAGSLEATLKSGFLMKVNDKVTKQMQAKKREEERKEKLERLYEKRSELDKQIKGLESQ